GGSGGWFFRPTRPRRGPAVPAPSLWTWLPLVAVGAGILWVTHDTWAVWLRPGGGVPGGVPMAAPPTMIVHAAAGAVPGRSSWGLVALLGGLLAPGWWFAAAGAANRNLAWVAMGGVAGTLPCAVALLDPGTRLTPAMAGALVALALAGAVPVCRFGQANH